MSVADEKPVEEPSGSEPEQIPSDHEKVSSEGADTTTPENGSPAAADFAENRQESIDSIPELARIMAEGNYNIIGNNNIIALSSPGDISQLIREFQHQSKATFGGEKRELPVERDDDLADFRQLQKSKEMATPPSKKRAGVRRKSSGEKDDPKTWFNALTENQKLYAMLVVLLKNLARERLDNVYILAVDNFRQEGLSESIDDPRTSGLDDLLQALHATEVNSVVQIPSSYAKEVEYQIDNRHHLLWSLFRDLLTNNEQEIASIDWEFRQAIGHAIGRTGTRYPNKLEALVGTIAAHPMHRIVVLAGHILAEIAGRGGESSQLFERILLRWVSSKQPKLAWAAASAIWRIYQVNHNNESVKAILWKNLDALIDNIDDVDEKSKSEILSLLRDGKAEEAANRISAWFRQRVDVISDALDHMFDATPSEVISRLTEWSEPDSQGYFSFIAQNAIEAILRRLARKEFQDFQTIFKSIAFFPIVLESTDSTLLDSAFNAFRAWFDAEVLTSDEKQQLINRTMQMIDGCTSSQLELVRKGLVDYFLSSHLDESDLLRSTASTLLTRTYFVDGYPILPAKLASVALFADATHYGRVHRSLDLVARIHAVLNCMVDTRVYLMGYSRMVGNPARAFSEFDMPISHNLPRLITGGVVELMKEKGTTRWLVIPLSYGPVIDLYDVANQFPRVGLALEKFDELVGSKRLEEEGNVKLIDNSPQVVSSGIEWPRIIGDISTFALENVYQIAASDLWNEASNLIRCQPQFEQVVSTLDEMLVQIYHRDNISRDKYFVVSLLFLWLWKKDSRRTMEICSSWLNSESSANYEFLKGICLGKFILRISLQADIPMADLAEFALSLLNKMPDWTGFELTLAHIEKALGEQSQQHRAEAINPAKLTTLLPIKLKSRIIDLVEDWISSKTTNVLLKDFGRKLKFFIDIGVLLTPPEIGDGQKFALVLVDGDMSAGEYLDLATEFLGKLEKVPLGKNTVPILYRLGQRVPLAVGYGTRNLESGANPTRSPNILNPIISIYPPDRVLFRAFIVKSRILDFEDKKRDWNNVPTVVYDISAKSRTLDSPCLLYMYPGELHGPGKSIADAIGTELNRMVRMQG